MLPDRKNGYVSGMGLYSSIFLCSTLHAHRDACLFAPIMAEGLASLLISGQVDTFSMGCTWARLLQHL